jgi:hypothetical protein
MQTHEFITEFLINGISTTQDIDLLQDFNFTPLVNVADIDGMDYSISYSDQQINFLNRFSSHIENNYIGQLFTTYVCLDKKMWDGVDSKSLEWHNDSKTGQDSCFLYYIDDCNEEVGGALYFKNETEEYKIYPKAGTLIWLSQNPKYLHKAEQSTKQRRVVHLEYRH